jgi:DNA-binding response OmpR family regulator
MREFEVALCINGVDGLKAFNTGKYDLCLVDIMMPRMDGFTFTREVRKGDQSIPIIFLTAKSLQEDKIEGFKIGCDDYITKPFSMEELLLRIHAVLKRSKGGEGITLSFEIGGYNFDYGKQILENSKGRIKLTPRESELLRLLCIHKGQILEREKALRISKTTTGSRSWGYTGRVSG